MREGASLDPQLTARLAVLFTDHVLDLADLPPVRADDVRDSFEIESGGHRLALRVICTITGSTYERDWDGSERTAVSLTEQAAEDTAYVVTRTPH